MKYVTGQSLIYKKYAAEVVFCYPSYKEGKDAYMVKFTRCNEEYHRLCMEDELSEEMQIRIIFPNNKKQ